MAPSARIIPAKVLANNGKGSFAAVAEALQWVIDHRVQHNITMVCMSLGDAENYDDDSDFDQSAVRQRITELRDLAVPVCIAAGNDFFKHHSAQGMSFPGILREAVSVGAVYDEFEGSVHLPERGPTPMHPDLTG